LSTYSEVVEAVMSATSRFCGNHLGLFLSPRSEALAATVLCLIRTKTDDEATSIKNDRSL